MDARKKRDIHFSDEPADKDLNLFQRTLPLRKRHKRESGRISKENATYYCEERISKTKIGKLCAKIGINVQALVNICSFDIEVKHLRFLIEIGCLMLQLPLCQKAFEIFVYVLDNVLFASFEIPCTVV